MILEKVMKIQSVDTLNGGEILAESIVNGQNEILLEKGTMIKNEYIELLKQLKITTVNLQDDSALMECPHYVLEQERMDNYVEQIQKILESHIYQEIYHGNHSLKKIKDIARCLTGELRERAENIPVFDIKIKSENLYEHTFFVTVLSVLIGIRMGLEEETLYTIAEGCLLHDLGLRYVTVPYMGFVQEEHSSAEVFEFKKHTILGYSALESAEWLNDTVRNMVLFHHERLDGSGFPLKQKKIGLECQIIQAVDAFCCKIFGVECRKTTIENAWNCLLADAGILYDKYVVTELLKLAALYPVGTKIEGRNSGIVIEQTENSLCPIIAVMNENGSLTGEKIRLEGDTCTNI